MTPSFWEVIANTPWWVYAFLIYFLRLGFLATKPRIVTLNKLSLLPTLFISMSLLLMHSIAQLSLSNFVMWIGACAFGGFLGWIHFFLLNVKAIENESKLYLPGTWSFLGFIIIIFGAQYYVHYQRTIDPTFFSQPGFAFWLFAGYGLLAGLFAGRMFYAFRCIKSGPFIKV